MNINLDLFFDIVFDQLNKANRRSGKVSKKISIFSHENNLEWILYRGLKNKMLKETKQDGTPLISNNELCPEGQEIIGPNGIEMRFIHKDYLNDIIIFSTTEHVIDCTAQHMINFKVND